MKLRAIPNYIIAEPSQEAATTPGGIVKPESAIARRPWATVIVIHPVDSERMGVKPGDNLMFHAANHGAVDVDYNGKTYIMMHVDNAVVVVEEDDSYIAEKPSVLLQ